MGEKRGVDPVSTALLVGGLAPTVLALQLDRVAYPIVPALAREGVPALDAWTAAMLLLVGGGCLTLFVRRSLRSRNPILDMGLFREKVFSVANGASFFMGASFMALLIFLPLFLVNVAGVSATRAGLSLIPFSMGIVAGSIAGGQLVSAVGHYRRILLFSGALFLVAIILLSRLSADTSATAVTLCMVLGGLGIGPSYPLYTLAIQNAVPVQRIGQATSASQFFRQIGATVGAAVMGTVLTAVLADRLGFVPIAMGGGSAGVASHEVDAIVGGLRAVEPDAIRAAFADAIARIFAITIGFVVIALVATMFLPELPLRREHDREVEAGG
jgi:hypothetical protein